MHAIKIFKTVKNGKASIHIPEEFGNEVEIIILPVNQRKRKRNVHSQKRILDIIGKAKISGNIFTELENARNEDRF